MAMFQSNTVTNCHLDESLRRNGDDNLGRAEDTLA